MKIREGGFYLTREHNGERFVLQCLRRTWSTDGRPWEMRVVAGPRYVGAVSLWTDSGKYLTHIETELDIVKEIRP